MPYRYFISGGSSGTSRNINYSSLDWWQIILDTAFVLNEFGIEHGCKTLIAQPSFPWDIGDVFAEACVINGADVICYGLLAGNEGMIEKWQEFSPNYIIAPTTLLLKVSEMDINISPDSFLISVGEPLSKDAENKLRSKWKPRDIRRIYGQSGLGTLGYQYDPELSLFCLNPRFHYFISNKENQPLKKEGVGRLLVQSKYRNTLIDTKDKVRLLKAQSKINLWNGEQTIEVLARDDHFLISKDGAYIHETIIQTLKNDFSLVELQCEQVIRNELEFFIFRYVEGENRVDEIAFIKRLSMLIPDLELTGNVNRFGVKIELSKSSIQELIISDRGKVPSLISNSNQLKLLGDTDK
jgi:hypothetical protein